MNKKQKVKKEQSPKKKKSQYKVRNWSEYNKALIKRYDIAVWIEQGIAKVWEETIEEGKERKRGGQRKFSEQAMDCLATLKEVFKLTYRGAQGFGQSLLVGVMGLEIQIPYFSTIQRRRKHLQITLPTKTDGGKIDIVFDSSGLKVYGEGEWKVRKHGASKRRTWRKIHLTINPNTNEIEAVEVTENNVDDAAMIPPMLAQIDKEINLGAGDGGYDKKKAYDVLAKRVKIIAIPPQRNAKIWVHGNTKGAKHPRDENLRRIRKIGRKNWKEEINYHKRSLAETGMYRFKTIFGDKLTSREMKQQEKEVLIKCKILNQMTHLGMPKSYKVEYCSP